MRARLGWMTALLVLGACGEEATDATDTDVEETDTAPPEVDASAYEIHPGAEQTFKGTLTIGENSLPLDFSGELLHQVAPIVGVDFRSFRGEIERDNPFAEQPPVISLVARVLIQEQVAEPGTYDCAGEGKFGLTLELYARSEKLPEKLYTTGRITDETAMPCTMVVTEITTEHVALTIDSVPMLDKDDKVVYLNDVELDLTLRYNAALEQPDDTDA